MRSVFCLSIVVVMLTAVGCNPAASAPLDEPSASAEPTQGSSATGCDSGGVSIAAVGDGTISVSPTTGQGPSCYRIQANTPVTFTWEVSSSVLDGSFSDSDVYFVVDRGYEVSLNPTGSGNDFYSLTASFRDGTQPFTVWAGACVWDVCTDSEYIRIYVDSGSGTPPPTALPTLYPTPQSAEEAAAAPLNCGSYLVSDWHYDPAMYGYPPSEVEMSGIGEATAEEAFDFFTPYLHGSPAFVHETDDKVLWVYLNEEGQKIGVITAEHTDDGWFITREQYCASVLK